MIKEIITSEGLFKKSLVGKSVSLNFNTLYVRPETSFDSSKIVHLNDSYQYNCSIVGEIEDWFYIQAKAQYRTEYGWIQKNNVEILGGVKSAFIKLLHRFSLRKAVC